LPTYSLFPTGKPSIESYKTMWSFNPA
jgi:hypothetical protein